MLFRRYVIDLALRNLSLSGLLLLRNLWSPQMLFVMLCCRGLVVIGVDLLLTFLLSLLRRCHRGCR